jgi:hypothetical protein
MDLRDLGTLDWNCIIYNAAKIDEKVYNFNEKLRFPLDCRLDGANGCVSIFRSKKIEFKPGKRQEFF